MNEEKKSYIKNRVRGRETEMETGLVFENHFHTRWKLQSSLLRNYFNSKSFLDQPIGNFVFVIEFYHTFYIFFLCVFSSSVYKNVVNFLQLNVR